MIIQMIQDRIQILSKIDPSLTIHQFDRRPSRRTLRGKQSNVLMPSAFSGQLKSNWSIGREQERDKAFKRNDRGNVYQDLNEQYFSSSASSATSYSSYFHSNLIWYIWGFMIRVSNQNFLTNKIMVRRKKNFRKRWKVKNLNLSKYFQHFSSDYFGLENTFKINSINVQRIFSFVQSFRKNWPKFGKFVRISWFCHWIKISLFSNKKICHKTCIIRWRMSPLGYF